MTAPDSPRVDFYVLNTTGVAGRLNFVCRLAEKACGTLNAIYAHTDSAEAARDLDERLWTFRQGSFVPHEIVGDAPPRAPVRIGTVAKGLEEGDLLINLTGQIPGFAKQFARIAEIVDADPAQRETGRNLYRQYRAMGLEPVTHNI